MEDLQLYKASLEEATEKNEIERFRISHKKNIACKQAIETAIRENFDGMRLNHDCFKPVLAEYGLERVEWVLANTLQQKEYDGRFSHSNKEWAKTIFIPESKTAYYDLRRQFVVESHPAVLDGFLSIIRREQTAREQPKQEEKKLSIQAQLSMPSMPRAESTERKKDKEVR